MDLHSTLFSLSSSIFTLPSLHSQRPWKIYCWDCWTVDSIYLPLFYFVSFESTPRWVHTCQRYVETTLFTSGIQPEFNSGSGIWVTETDWSWSTNHFLPLMPTPTPTPTPAYSSSSSSILPLMTWGCCEGSRQEPLVKFLYDEAKQQTNLTTN